MEKRKRGRPPIDGAIRSARVTIRLDPEKARQFELLAKSLGLSVTELARQLIYKASEKHT